MVLYGNIHRGKVTLILSSFSEEVKCSIRVEIGLYVI